MPSTKHDNKCSASLFTKTEAEVEDCDSGDKLISEKETVDVMEWKDGSPEVEQSGNFTWRHVPCSLPLTDERVHE